MTNDLRSILVSELQKLGSKGLSFLGFVSKAFLEESAQLKTQQGIEKRTYFWDYVGNLGHVIGIATKYVGDKIRTQRAILFRPSGETVSYKFLYQKDYGILTDSFGMVRADPNEAVKRMLREAYGFL